MSSPQALLALSSLPVISSLVAYARTVEAAKYRAFILALVVFWMIQVVADIVWMLIPAPETKPLAKIAVFSNRKTSSSSAVSSKAEQADIEMMQSWALFGDFKAEKCKIEIMMNKINIQTVFTPKAYCKIIGR